MCAPGLSFAGGVGVLVVAGGDGRCRSLPFALGDAVVVAFLCFSGGATWAAASANVFGSDSG